MNHFEEIAQLSKSVEAALVELHEAGASPGQAITALHKGRRLTLSDSKEELMKSPAWYVEADAANRLHDQLESLLDEEENKQR